MADYTVEDSRWNNRVSLIETYMNDNACGDMEAVLKWNISQGTNNPEQRRRYWDNLTNMFACVDNSPLKQTGRASTLPQVVQDSLAVLEATYKAGHAALYASSPLFGKVESKRGQTAQPYGSEDNYVSAMTSNFLDRMKAAYKAYEKGDTTHKQWDGTLDKDGLPEIVIPEEKDGGKA